jgi:hypothetical protein
MDLLLAATYIVVPPLEALQQYGLSWTEMHRLQVLFMVTDEMLGSCIAYMDALKKNQIILIEGSHTPTSSRDTNPSRLGGTSVLQCQISLPITVSNASI